MRSLVFCFALMITTYTSSAQKANDALLLDMYQSQRYMDAANYLKSVYPEPISDMKVLSRFAYTYQMAGKMPDALGYYQRIYNQDSTNIPVLFNLASLNVKRENNVMAVSYYRKIIIIDSLNFTVYKRLGHLYCDQLDTLNATKYLQKANTINPEDPDVASELSLFLVIKKKNKEADKVLRRALAADSTNLFLLRTLMKLNYTMSKFAETIKTCKTLLELGDKSMAIYDKMASSYYGLKNYECCIDAFIEIRDVFQTERTLYLTAVSYKKLKNYNKAIDYYEQTLQHSIAENTWDYYSELADTYQTTYKFKIAAANYQKSLFFQDNSKVIYTLAYLYDNNLKDKCNALKYYKKYLDSKPPAKDKDYINYVQSRVKVLSKK